MRNTVLEETPAGIKISGRNINNLRYTDDTTLMAEREEELKSLLMKVKEESEKVGLNFNTQKTQIMASGPITSWQIDGETMETVTDFILGGSKITEDGDCSHEIKRCLLFGRKAMINLDSILKSRDITLPAKIRLVKAMVFPVVMYGCESWTIKKAEHRRIDAFELCCWRRLLRVSWPKPYLFYGFLDKQHSKKKKELEELSNYPFTIVFYESPLRLKSTLKLMYEVLGDRKASISREITKLYEETIYLNLSEYESLDENLKGEMVICISPCLKEAVSIDYKKEMDKLLSKGLKVKDAARVVADMCGISYKEIYNEYARGQK